MIEGWVGRGFRNEGWESLERERAIKGKWMVSTGLGLISIFNGKRICLLGLSLTIWGNISALSGFSLTIWENASALSSHRTPLLEE